MSYLARVEFDLERPVLTVARLEPFPHLRLLERRCRVADSAGEDGRLLVRMDPRHDERDVVAELGQVRHAQQSIHRGARLPRQGRRRHDCNVHGTIRRRGAESAEGLERRALLKLDAYVRNVQPQRHVKSKRAPRLCSHVFADRAQPLLPFSREFIVLCAHPWWWLDLDRTNALQRI